MNAQYVKAEGTAKSQILDEEVHMQQFVERELAKRLGKSVDGSEQKLTKQEQEELELYKLPEGFQVGVSARHFFHVLFHQRLRASAAYSVLPDI